MSGVMDKKREEIPKRERWIFGGTLLNKSMDPNLINRTGYLESQKVGIVELNKSGRHGGGAEFRMSNVRVSFGGRTIRDRFIMKRSVLDSESWIKNYHIEDINKRVISSYKKFLRLREINKKQDERGHKFNLPNTVRLIINQRGILRMLITDETKSDSKTLVDFKYHRKRTFSQKEKEMIKHQILNDFKLSNENGINIVIGDMHPLDTWYGIVDRKTGELEKVMMLDVGNRVEINSNKLNLDGEGEIADALSEIRVRK